MGSVHKRGDNAKVRCCCPFFFRVCLFSRPHHRLTACAAHMCDLRSLMSCQVPCWWFLGCGVRSTPEFFFFSLCARSFCALRHTLDIRGKNWNGTTAAGSAAQNPNRNGLSNRLLGSSDVITLYFLGQIRGNAIGDAVTASASTLSTDLWCTAHLVLWRRPVGCSLPFFPHEGAKKLVPTVVLWFRRLLCSSPATCTTVGASGPG